MTYKSKVDAWLVVATVGVVAATVVPCLFVDFSWAALAIMLLTLALILLALFGIRYEVVGGKLRVSCCRLVMDTIDISKITQIRPTRTLISAASRLNRPTRNPRRPPVCHCLASRQRDFYQAVARNQSWNRS